MEESFTETSRRSRQTASRASPPAPWRGLRPYNAGNAIGVRTVRAPSPHVEGDASSAACARRAAAPRQTVSGIRIAARSHPSRRSRTATAAAFQPAMRGHGPQALRSGKAGREFAAKASGEPEKRVARWRSRGNIAKARCTSKGSLANPESLPPARAQALRPALPRPGFPARREGRGFGGRRVECGVRGLRRRPCLTLRRATLAPAPVGLRFWMRRLSLRRHLPASYCKPCPRTLGIGVRQPFSTWS